MRIQREIEVQSKLKHDGIVKLYHSFVAIDDASQRKQYLGGGFLKRKSRGKLCECQCFAMFAQLVDIVRYLLYTDPIHHCFISCSIHRMRHSKLSARISGAFVFES